MAGSLDFETTPSYSLTLTATDSGSLTDTTAVVISVRDVNESPSFVGAPYSSIVPENDAAASVVTVAATDQDFLTKKECSGSRNYFWNWALVLLTWCYT